MTVLGTDRLFRGIPDVGLISALTIITDRPSAPSFQVIAPETYVPAPSRNRSAPEESNREFPEPGQSPASPVRLDLSPPAPPQ